MDLRWLTDRWERGDALIVRLTVRAVVVDDDGEVDAPRAINHGVWVERDTVPRVEAQVAEIAPMDYADLAAKLRERGLDVAFEDFEDGFVHVELDEPLRAALTQREMRSHTARE